MKGNCRDPGNLALFHADTFERQARLSQRFECDMAEVIVADAADQLDGGTEAVDGNGRIGRLAAGALIEAPGADGAAGRQIADVVERQVGIDAAQRKMIGPKVARLFSSILAAVVQAASNRCIDCSVAAIPDRFWWLRRACSPAAIWSAAFGPFTASRGWCASPSTARSGQTGTPIPCSVWICISVPAAANVASQDLKPFLAAVVSAPREQGCALIVRVKSGIGQLISGGASMSNEDNPRVPGEPSGLPKTSQGADAPRGEGIERTGEGEAERDLQKALWDDLDEGRRFAREQVEQVKTDVTRKAEGQKNVAARQLSGVGTAIEKVGAELEQSDQPALGRYARQIGSSLRKYARDVEGRSLGEIAAVAEDFGRRQPLAFLGLAAIAGLSASRFLVASSERRTRREPSGKSPSPDRPLQMQEELRNG